MTIDHVPFVGRAFGGLAFVLLLMAAPIASVIFLSQSF